MGTNLRLRVLIFILFVLIIFYISTNLLPEWWHLKLNPFKGDYVNVMQEYYNMNKNFQMHESLIKKKEKLINETDSLNISTEILHEDIISQLNEMCLDNNISISKINFTEIMMINLEKNNEEQTDKSLSVDAEGEAITVKVTLEYRSSYEDMLKFIDDFNNDEIKASITQVNLLSWVDDEVYGIIIINYYAMPLHKGE